MPDPLAPLRPEEGGAGAHGGHHGLLLAAHGQGARAAGGKLVHRAGGKAVDIPLHIGGPHAGEDHPLHVRQGEAVPGEVAAKGTVEAGEGLLRLDPEGGEESSGLVKAHDLRRGAPNVNAEDGLHSASSRVDLPAIMGHMGRNVNI